MLVIIDSLWKGNVSICFLLSLCRFGALWSSKLLFFCPCIQVWRTLKFKTCVFLSLCRFGALWSLKPNAIVRFCCDIVPIVCNVLDICATFCFPCSFLKGQARFSCKGFTIWRLIGAFSEPDSGFRKLEFFPFETSICLQSYACKMHFLLVFAVFWTCDYRRKFK